MVKNISSAAPKFTRFTPPFPGIVLRVVDSGGRCRLSSGALGIDVVMPFVDESSPFVCWSESVSSLRALRIRLLLITVGRGSGVGSTFDPSLGVSASVDLTSAMGVCLLLSSVVAITCAFFA